MPVTNYYTVNGQIIGESTGGVRTSYMVDPLGSVIGTIDESANVVNTYRYKPYGALLAKTGSGSDPANTWVGAWGYRQTGKRYADAYVRARYYGSLQAAWTTRDPYWPFQLAFVLANNSPALIIDPSGLSPITIEMNAFIPKRLGQWINEPLSLEWAYYADNRNANQAGTSRIGTSFTIDSCSIGGEGSGHNNTGVSRRIKRWHPGVIETRASTIVTNFKSSHGSGQGPGQGCLTSFHNVVSSAYPFLPPVAPTALGLGGTIKVVSDGVVSINVDFAHSLFPDFEVLVKHNGISTLLYSYETDFNNFILFLQLTTGGSGSITLSIPTQTCCTHTPCCLGECQ